MGNAFVAVADNGDAVFANPAGLATAKGRQLAYTNVSLLFSGIDGDNLGQHIASFIQPLGSKLSVGLGYERIGSDLMSENGAFLSLGYKLSSKFQLGLSGKYLFWSVDDFDSNDPLSGQSKGTVGVDLGLLWTTPVQGARLGVMLKNLNQPNAAADVAGSIPSDAGQLPMDLGVGISYTVDNSLIAVQWTTRDLTGDEAENRLVVGGETKLVEGLLLRAGGSRIFEDDASGDLNAGLGYRWNKLLFDYGYHIPLDLTETNGSHRFSLAWQL
ncbi:uncharacterized protein METZ01_LOCUS407251 [marine metagenome]|uniref:PorV/PorQ family protein n=1 Tax=marine metagenome TaxID=408172 RepID=A0A382W6I5_9ZZZZ